MIRNVSEILGLVTEILVQAVGKSFVKTLHVPSFYIKRTYYLIFFFNMIGWIYKVKTNYVQSLGEQASCFADLKAPNGCVQQRKQLSKRFALIGLYF